MAKIRSTKLAAPFNKSKLKILRRYCRLVHKDSCPSGLPIITRVQRWYFPQVAKVNLQEVVR